MVPVQEEDTCLAKEGRSLLLAKDRKSVFAEDTRRIIIIIIQCPFELAEDVRLEHRGYGHRTKKDYADAQKTNMLFGTHC